MAHARQWAVPVWSGVLALVVLAPLVRPGYVLSYDMVWVPHLDLSRADVWGLGSSLPRAVPSDAVVALVGAVLPQPLVQRLVLGATLVLAGIGAARLVDRGLLARLAAATFAVWNPYVAERLVIGHWPLLAGYAALFWLVVAARERRWVAVTGASLVMALTPVGGLMAFAATVVITRSVWRPVAVGAVVNAPWIVAALLAPGVGSTDPAGVEAFAIEGEGPLGRLGAALSLGGVWNSDAALPSRDLWTTWVVTGIIWLLMVVGARAAWRCREPAAGALAVLAVGGLLVATLGWWGAPVLEWAVERVDALALLRDGTRWLALAAPAACIAVAGGVEVVRQRCATSPALWAVPVAAMLLPVAALPDLAVGASGRLAPVAYPAEWERARSVVAASASSGDVLSLPLSAFRRPAWNDDRVVLDPAGRFFDRVTVTDDRLVVGDVVVAGEDPRAAAVRALGPGPWAPEQLASLGLGIVVVDTTAPGADAALASVAELEPLGEQGGLQVWAVPEGGERVDASRGRTLAVAAAWVVWGAAIVGAALGATRRRERRL